MSETPAGWWYSRTAEGLESWFRFLKGKNMLVSSLHKDQRKILETLRLAANSLKLTERMAIVGGLAKYLAGDTRMPGDVDVLIEEPVCERYWELVEILTKHGINSGWEVLDPPSFPTWSPCHPEDIGHAMHFTVGPRGGEYKKHEALDFCFTVADLHKIPRSSQWIIEEPRVSRASLLANDIEERHRAFVEGVQKNEKRLLEPQFSDAVQLYYRLVNPIQANP